MDQALIESVKAGNVEGVENLLNAGAEINQGDEQGWTPLNFSAGKGDLTMVRLLTERGADPFKVGRDNRTPCMIALAAGRVEVVKYLREFEDRTDPEKAKSFRPEQKYCKAYYLRDLQKFPGWSESKINWKENRDERDDSSSDGGESADSKVVFIHQDFTVTESTWHNENVIFNQISTEWRGFCLNALDFKVPTDLDLIVASQEASAA